MTGLARFNASGSVGCLCWLRCNSRFESRGSAAIMNYGNIRARETAINMSQSVRKDSSVPRPGGSAFDSFPTSKALVGEQTVVFLVRRGHDLDTALQPRLSFARSELMHPAPRPLQFFINKYFRTCAFTRVSLSLLSQHPLLYLPQRPQLSLCCR